MGFIVFILILTIAFNLLSLLAGTVAINTDNKNIANYIILAFIIFNIYFLINYLIFII